MHEIIQNLIHYGYPLLFLWVFSERLGIPIPATLPLISAGILADMEHMQFAYAVGLAFAAVMLADFAWFFLSRVRGVQVLSFLCRVTLEPDACVRKTQKLFVKHGPASLLFAKFIPGLSTLMVPLVGIVHMRLRSFLLFDSIGSLIWVVFFMGAGYLFSREIDLERIALPDWGQGSVFLAVLVLLVLYIVWKYLRKQYLLRELLLNSITPEELKRKLDAGDEIAIVDVRHLLEFEADPYVIPGALYFPLEHLAGFSAVFAEREIVTYCA
ncbi:MAG: VTT domain-containing protein [Deltaproteobacteria bacterium]|nr:VTT domain-containing protein [Deltaproteobacteria bacterium]